MKSTNWFPAMVIGGFIILCQMQSCRDPGGNVADKWEIGPFIKLDEVNPILTPDAGQLFHCPIRDELVMWEQKDVFNPAVIFKEDTLFMIYRAEDTVGIYNGTSRLGLAYSLDAMNFIKYPQPVLFPDLDDQQILEWEGGIEDPRIVETPEGDFLMTYTAYDGDIARLLLARSPDLRRWTKYGTVLKNEFKDHWSKSGSIVSRWSGSRLVAERINNRYWMYFGDKNIHIAWSENLLDWTPILDDSGELAIIFGPRENHFDSDLVEPGPPAFMTRHGIHLIYNGRNYGEGKISSLPNGTYAAGQILFDPANPARILNRTTEYFIRPEKEYEITGQVNQVVFLEGLAKFNEKWWLYYGTADSKIAVASSPFSGDLVGEE